MCNRQHSAPRAADLIALLQEKIVYIAGMFVAGETLVYMSYNNF